MTTESTLTRPASKNVAFTPRHYPTNKPTTLKTRQESEHIGTESGNVKDFNGKSESEEDDPFKEDLRKFNGKRMRQEVEDLIKLKHEQVQTGSSVVMLTKDEDERIVEDKTEKKKSKRRRR